MAELTTSRLRIVALSLPQFAMFIAGDSALAADLGAAPPIAPPEGHTLDAMRWLLARATDHPEHHAWYTCWLIARKEDGRVVGSACFKGPPDMAGQVEAGYGIDAAYRLNGYMSEAAGALYAWALLQPGVRAVLAETDRDNLASRRVCERCGMRETGMEGDRVLWRLECDRGAGG